MFAGTWTLIKLIFRRDRIKLPVWIVAIVASLVSMVPMLRNVYGDETSLATLHETFGTNPAGIFLTGPMDAPTLGGLMTIETVLWWGLAVAFMNTLFVVRHTRQNEEMGAQELLLSGRAHRASGLIAALVVALGANLLLAVGIGVGLILVEASWSAEQAWLFGLSMGSFGFAWSAVAAIVVQLVQSARSANGMLAAAIGGAFVLRGIGDFMGRTDASGLLQPEWPSLLSPFGWMQATRPLTFPEWWPLLLPLVFAVVAIPVAFFLLSKRDVGASILPSRKGRPHARAFLKTPLGLTWHLQRNVFLGWLAGVMIMVATIGVLVPEMTHIYESSESMKAMIVAMGGEGAMVPSFLSAMLSMIALMVIGYVVHALGRLRAEESSGHLENLLATRMSRMSWIAWHSAIALAGGIFMLVASGMALAVSVNIASDFTADTMEYTLAGISYIPSLLLFIGGYIVLFGVIPRLSSVLMWLYFGFVVFMAWLAPMLRLEQWVMDISPLSHIAAAPAEDIKVVPLLVIGCLGLMLAVVGVVAWRNRNLLEQ